MAPSALASWIRSWIDGKAPSNVWIGTTVEDQQRADERIPHLISIPARVRFLSCEPLLGPVDIEEHLEDLVDGGYVLGSAPIHWVICGGESGAKARPMHPDWARSLRDQCKAAGVPYFYKQWGEWAPWTTRDEWTEKSPCVCIKSTGELSWWSGNEDTTTNWSTNYEEGDHPIERVGKKAAGRLLDGVEHSEFPRDSISSLTKPSSAVVGA